MYANSQTYKCNTGGPSYNQQPAQSLPVPQPVVVQAIQPQTQYFIQPQAPQIQQTTDCPHCHAIVETPYGREIP